jgi:hypothetical protein
LKPTVVLVLLAITLLSPGVSELRAQGAEYHGADSTFEIEGLVLMWAIWRGPDEGSTQVVLDIVKSSSAADRYRFYSVMAVDPFTGESRPEVQAQPLAAENRVLRARPDFQIFSARRILFFADEPTTTGGPAELTVYYQGVPDTSPEFSELGELEAYFDGVLQRLSE